MRWALPFLLIVTLGAIPQTAGAQATPGPSAEEIVGPSAEEQATSGQAVEGAPSPREAAEGCTWDERWGRFSVAQSVATASLAAGILTVHLALPPPEEANWSRPVLMDEGVRLGLRSRTEGGRETMAEASDWLVRGLIAWPLIDAGVAWTAHRAPEVAAQMMALNAQSYALTFLVTELTKRLVGRERPYAQAGACDGDETSDDCTSRDRYKSFLSGHTSMSFTGAGLVCAHHENLPLYGGGPADSLACATALGAAAAVGVFRVAADRHYASDVLLGAALGLLSGYGLPNWLHYDLGDDDPDTGASSAGSISPIATPGGVGFGYQHIWY